MRRINRYFLSCLLGLLTLDATADDNTTKWCEWWIDHNFEARTQEPMKADGTWSQAIPVSGMKEGLHTLALRIGDKQGLWSGPIFRHFAVVPTAAARENALTVMEYWLDHDFAARQTAAMNGNAAELTLDMSGLKPGLHTLAYRVGDKHGMWSMPAMRHFIRTIAPKYLANSVRQMRYWLDYDLDAAQTVAMSADGSAEVNVDASLLTRGLHVITYQVQDEHGMWGPAMTQHFMRPGDADLTGDKIAGYRYWFNYGPAVTVEVEPTDRLVLADVVIPVTGVVPHSIPTDYRLDINTGTVWCPDEVTFGIRAFDNAGKESGAVMSDAFMMDVPVSVKFESLTEDVEQLFDAPMQGDVLGLYIPHSRQGYINICVNGQCTMDMYNEDGTPFAMERSEDETGTVCYDAATNGTPLFALVYNAAQVGRHLSVKYHVNDGQGVANTFDGLRVMTNGKGITFDAAEAVDVAVYSVGGGCVYAQRVEKGRTSVSLPAGIYMARCANHDTIKVVVR